LPYPIHHRFIGDALCDRTAIGMTAISEHGEEAGRRTFFTLHSEADEFETAWIQ